MKNAPQIDNPKVAIVVADGVKAEPVAMLLAALTAAGAVPRLLSDRLGTIRSADGQEFEVDATLGNTSAESFHALALPDGQQAVTRLASDSHAIEFLRDQYRYGRTIFVGSASAALVAKAGVHARLPSGKVDPGLIFCSPTQFVRQISHFLAVVGSEPFDLQ